MVYAMNGGAPVMLRVDLPSAGTYAVHVAQGDAGAGGPFSGTVRVYDTDGVRLLAALMSGAVTAPDQYIDATGAVRTSAADWKANEQAPLVTVSGPTVWIRIGADATSGNTGGVDATRLAHLRLVQQ